MAATFLILLGAIIGAGFVGNLFFERTRVPPVLLLIAVGMVLGPLAHVVPPEAVRPFTPFFGAKVPTPVMDAPNIMASKERQQKGKVCSCGFEVRK